MSNLTPFGGKNESLAPVNFFDIFNHMETMMLNTFQSAFTPMNNTTFNDQGTEYIENQNLILTVKQVVQANEETGQAYQSSSFSQSFSLYDVDADKITANLTNDTLTIVLPKKESMVINRRLINIL